MEGSAALRVLEATYRAESRRLFARLVRALGDFDAAEDALQDSMRAATTQWPQQGVPENPAGWLFQTAKFRGISILRQKLRLVPLTENEEADTTEPNEVGDELLRLVFTCCHPAISPDAQVALTLREVYELTTEEIAAAYLTPAPTIAQRIVRAKAKIREAGIPFEVPSREEQRDRLEPVLKTIYLIFNEGYASSSGEKLVRQDLMSMAIHLGRQLYDLVPEPEVGGLLALMLLHHARTRTRLTPEGEIALLEDQDRTLWDLEAIREASELVTASLTSWRYGPYSLQAAIAALYAEAPSYAETNWNEIIGLYDVLLRIQPSPVASLNRAVAVAMRDGPAVGIALIDELLASQMLEGYHRAYAARGELHLRSGNREQALQDYEAALALARQETERRYLQRRFSEISAPCVDSA